MVGRILTLPETYLRPDPAPDWMWTANISAPGLYLHEVYVESHNWPFSNNGSDPRFVGGQYKYYPKHLDTEQCTIQFTEDEFYTVIGFLDQWRDLVFDSNNNFGIPVDYMGSIELTRFSNEGIPTFVGRLQEVWPLGIASWNNSYDKSGPVITAGLFSVNRSNIVFTAGSALASLGVPVQFLPI